MRRLCQLAKTKSAPANLTYGSYAYYQMRGVKDTSEDECMEEVAVVCLEMKWHDIYQALKSKWKLKKSALETLGVYLGSNEYDAGLWKVQELLQSESNLPERLEALGHLHEGIERSSPLDSGRSQAHDFCRDILKHTLHSCGPLRKDTVQVIAGVIVAYEPELDGLFLTALKRCTTPTIAGLLLHIDASNSADEAEDTKDFLWKLLDLLWTSTFRLEGPEIPQKVPKSWGQMQLPPQQDILTHAELVALLEINRKYGSTPAVDVLPILSEAIAQTSPTYSREHVLPFIALLVKRQVPTLFPYDTRTPNDNVTSLIRDGLTAIVTNYITLEPQRATDFALPRGSCGCADCSRINTFLVSQQKQHDFPVAQKRRAHLHQVFTDKGKGMYDVVTLRGGSPNIWQITKTFDKHYANEHRAWTLRVKWLKSELGKLARVQNGLLTEETIGKDVYRGIMGCTMEGLHSVATGRRALLATSGNARKRKAEGREDENAKETRTRAGSGGVEIIDLT